MRVAVLLSSALLIAATAASAHTTLVHPDGQPWGGKIQRVVDRSLVPTPDGRIVLKISYDGILPGSEGQTDGERILLAPIWPHWNRYHDVMHELGHIYDDRYLTPTSRLAIERAIFHRGDDWNLGGLPDTPSEQFAEAYSYAGRGEAFPAKVGVYGLRRFGPNRMALLRTWLTNLPRLEALGLMPPGMENEYPLYLPG